MSKEMAAEKLSRLRMMADPDECWDLSEKDTEAIQFALKLIDSLAEHVEACTGRSRQYVMEAHSGKVEQWEGKANE
jgi:hypothetical protein